MARAQGDDFRNGGGDNSCFYDRVLPCDYRLGLVPDYTEADKVMEAEEEKVNEELKWYVVHTYSGYEAKVRVALEEQFKMLGISERLGEVLIPMEDVKEFRGGKQKVSSRKLFPGYVLIQLDLNDKVLAAIKDAPRVTGFIGGTIPSPLSDAEVQQIRDQLAGTVEKPRPKVAFMVGDTVRVIDGPFTHFSGKIEEVNQERGKVKLMVSIFGRATPVELDFPQIEKV